MQDKDRKEFISVLKSTMEVFDKHLSADALEIWWATMESISIADFRKAMTQHLTTSQFAPKPADLLNQFRKDDGRPGAEKAWSMIPHDQEASCVWTEEMAEAFGAAAPLLDDGDTIGARMAFKESYQSAVENARNEGKPVKWSVSLGWDKAQREEVVMKAVQQNLISHERAVALLPESTAINGLDDRPMIENQNKIKKLIQIAKKEPDEDPDYDESKLLKEAQNKFEGINQTHD